MAKFSYFRSEVKVTPSPEPKVKPEAPKKVNKEEVKIEVVKEEELPPSAASDTTLGE